MCLNFSSRYSNELVDQAFDNIRQPYERWYDFAATQGHSFEARYGRAADGAKREGERPIGHRADG